MTTPIHSHKAWTDEGGHVTLTPMNCASWWITTTLSSVSAGMRAAGEAAINALLPASAGARIDAADHGQD
jgi:hypothetical protein